MLYQKIGMTSTINSLTSQKLVFFFNCYILITCCKSTNNTSLFRVNYSCSVGYKYVLLGLATSRSIAVNCLLIVWWHGRYLYFIYFKICLFSLYTTLHLMMASSVYDITDKTNITNSKKGGKSYQLKHGCFSGFNKFYHQQLG